MKQVDLICTQCPLADCSEESLWCLFRFMTNPNPAQKALLKKKNAVKRGDYWSGYYQENRDKKLAQAKIRYAKLKLEKQKCLE